MADPTEDLMNYEALAASALRGAVRLALQKVLDGGGVFPKPHHAYITFRTDYPGVMLAKFQRSKYPTEMTVVLQNGYSGLHLSETDFSVVLSFSQTLQRITVPWAAISRYYDPSVQFLLQFDVEPPAKPKPIEPVEPGVIGGNVVALRRGA